MHTATETVPKPLRVLFSPKPSAEKMLASKLQGFEAAYRKFDDPALDPDDYDLVVPLRLDALRQLNGPQGARLRAKALVPPAHVIDLCNDKLAFAKYLLDQGYEANVPVVTAPAGYPYMLKRRSDEWGEHSHLIAGEEDEQRYAAQLASEDYFTQAFVRGAEEYATHMLVAGTKVTHCSTVQIRFDADNLVFGEGIKPLGFRKAENQDHIRLFAGILVRLGYEGLCCFDYKVVNGAPQIFELNPRFGGSLAFTPNGALRAYAKIVVGRQESQRQSASI